MCRCTVHGRSQDFSKGGHTDSYRGYSSDCHLNIVSCLLTRRLTKGGSRAPQDPPWLRLCSSMASQVIESFLSFFQFYELSMLLNYQIYFGTVAASKVNGVS